MSRQIVASVLLFAWFTVTPVSAQTELDAIDGVTIKRDVTFLAPDREEKLDLYRPERNDSRKPMPAVVIIHGGGWVKGDKAKDREFISGTTLAKAGFVAISINYETRKGKRWPGNLHDCKNAVRWLRKNAKELDIDSSRIGVIGGSAGGHLALMVAYTGDHPKLSDNNLYSGISDKVSACIDMYGITNLLTRKVTDKKGNSTGELKEHRLFSEDREQAPEKWRDASPVNYIDKDSPPTLIFHGTRDKTVDRDQSKELFAALQKAGVPSELKMVEGAGHAWPLKTDDFDFRSKMIDFFNQHLTGETDNARSGEIKSPKQEPNQEPKPEPKKDLQQSDASRTKHPNVLFIAIDDLNDWEGALDGHPQAHTPNMDRLFKQGVLFTNAHCSQAVCNASRNSVLSGLHPSSSGWYGSTKIMQASYADVMVDHKMLPQFFRDHGYRTMTAGKIYHKGASDFPNLTDEFWDEIAPGYKVSKDLLKRGDGYKGKKFYPFPKNGSQMSRMGKEYDDGNSLCWGALDRDDMPGGKMYDELISQWAVEKLQQDYDKPFFMAVGFLRPHLPYTAPKEFFDLYNLEKLPQPVMPADEMSDIPMMGKSIAYGRLLGGDDYAVRKVSEAFSQEMVLAYLACVSFVDAQVGKVVDALEASGHADDTVIVLWSDHGQHLGEKRTWRKQTLWEEATRVPLFFKAPGGVTPSGKNSEAVSLLDIYPTLVDLCDLPKSERLEGESLVPLFEHESASRGRPVLSSWYYGNFAVRSNRWRYIRYRDGTTELYDHESDGGEHKNLMATDSLEFKQIAADLERWISPNPALPAGSTVWKKDTLDKRIDEWEKANSVPQWLK